MYVASPISGRRPLLVAVKFFSTISVLIFALALVVHSATASQSTTSPTTQPALLTDTVCVYVEPEGTHVWSLTIYPSGSAFIQYGSTFGDSASLPNGTFDFREIVAEVSRQQSKKPIEGNTVAGLYIRSKQPTELQSLKDDAYFRRLIQSVTDRWQNKGQRFDDLRKQYPIYSLSTNEGH